MALSKVTYVDGVTIIGAKNLNDIQDELIRQGEQQTEDEESMETALALKADKETTYTKTEVDTALALKADKSDTFTKAEVNSALALKADKSDTYTKTEVNEALELKADKSDTYTKAVVDSMIQEAVEEAVKESEYSNFEMKSVSGDFVHITDGAGLIPVKDLKIGIEAVQDLHGYDAPWVGGAGKNKLNLSDGSVGTSSKVAETSTLPAGTYTFSIEAYRQDAGSATFKVYVSGTVVAETETVNESTAYKKISATFTIAEPSTVYVWASFYSSYSTLYYRNAMIESGSEATAFAPYANICPISGWTGAKVSVNGINQWDEEWEVGAYDGSGNKVVNANAIRSVNKFPILPNTAYYLYVGGGISSSARFCYYDADKTFISSETIPFNSAITTPSNARYLAFNCGGAYGNSYNHDISINYPSTDTDYHAYNGKTYEVTWQTEAGTVYGGTLDVTTGEGVITDVCVDVGDLTEWGYATDNIYNVFYIPKSSLPSDPASVVNVKIGYSSALNVLPCMSFSAFANNDNGDGTATFVAASSGTERLLVRYDAETTVEGFVSAMDGVQLVYKLKTPVPFTIDPTTDIVTLLGENNIFADTGAIEELIYRISRQA